MGHKRRLSQKELYRIQTTQRNMERAILNITLKDKKLITWIREQTKMEGIGCAIMRMKWQWTGHIAQIGPEKWMRITKEWKPWARQRSVGRPLCR